MAKKRFTERDLPGDTGYGMTNAAFANQLTDFIERGFPESLWTKRLYKVLMQRFMHIAHYNEIGFWDTWFCNLRVQVEWLEHVTKGSVVGWCNDPDEVAIRTWIVETDQLGRYRRMLDMAVEAFERKQLAALQEKYPANV